MNRRDQLTRDRQNRVGRLEAMNALAVSENRDLTDAEREQATIMRSEVAAFNEELRASASPPTSDQPTNAELAASVQRTEGLASALYGSRYGGGQQADPWSAPDETSIRRVANDISNALGDNQAIKRAITLPVGYGGGNAAAGALTDVLDLATYFTVAGVDGTHADVVKITGTEGQVVAEGAPKPDIVTASLEPAPTKKVAGMAIATTETLVFVGGAERVIREVLRDSIIAGQNGLIATEALTGTAFPYATSAIHTVLAAVATIGTKSTASVVLLNPADYAGLALDTAALPQNVGLPPFVVSDDITAGSAVVAARSGIQVARTPVMMLADPYTLADVNKTRLVADMFVAVNLVRDDLVLVADLTVV